MIEPIAPGATRMPADFIFMLTRNDRTIDAADACLDIALASGVRHLGFKDIGQPLAVLGRLRRAIHAAGARCYLEVVSQDRESELASVRAALELDVDCLLGGTHVDEALALLAGEYSANAYAYSTRYQNCNQWLVELMASAWGADAPRREDAQRWLRERGMRFSPASEISAVDGVYEDLHICGYEVDVAVDGADGWNSVRAHRYDLVVTDLDMPRMGGLELVRAIKRIKAHYGPNFMVTMAPETAHTIGAMLPG